MRRFLLNRGYGCNNWPQEYASDFFSLLSHCPYTKGSLRAAEECTNQEIEALPPVAECAWLPHEKDALNHICKDMAKSSSYQILTLFQKCKAIKMESKGFVIGSSNSRYSTSSYVMATHPRYPGNKPQLARIEYFAKLDILSLSNVMSYWYIFILTTNVELVWLSM